MMKIQFLKYFCVLAEELHFRRAADRLAISQPPLSTAIRKLEEELGVQLLLRNSKRVELTPAGSAFLVEAKEILDRVARVGSVVRAIDGGAHGRLDIGVAGSMFYRELPAMLARFQQEMPAVEVVLHELYTTEQIDKLLRRQLHAVFVQASVLPAPLACLPLRNDVFVACLPQDHRLSGNKRVHLRELADESFIMFSRESAPASHDHVIGIFSRAGIHPRTVHRARIWMTVVAMVGSGCGVAIVPRSLSQGRIAGVCFVPLGGDPAPVPGMLAWNPGLVPPALKAFIASATAVVRGRVGSHSSRSSKAPRLTLIAADTATCARACRPRYAGSLKASPRASIARAYPVDRRNVFNRDRHRFVGRADGRHRGLADPPVTSCRRWRRRSC